MTDRQRYWDDIRRMADELELQIHLATMEAREKWRELKPRIADIEKVLTEAGERTGSAVTEELTAIGKAVRQLRDDVAKFKPN